MYNIDFIIENDIHGNQYEGLYQADIPENIEAQYEEEEKYHSTQIVEENSNTCEVIGKFIKFSLPWDIVNEIFESEKVNEKICYTNLHYIPIDTNIEYSRAKTAPTKTLSELEKLKNSKQFFCLESSVISSTQLIQKSGSKFDFDSAEGQRNCKGFLQELETLFDIFQVPYIQRKYRDKFSQAYKVLYKHGELCYLVEILDSAQEAFPFLWVNNEKYIFSPSIINSAKELFGYFIKIRKILRLTYNKICGDGAKLNLKQMISNFRLSLYNFDKLWTKFEYVCSI